MESLWVAPRHDPTSWYSHPWVIPSPGVCAGFLDSLLTSRIWQKWWDVASKVKKTVAFILGLFFSLSCSVSQVASSGRSQLPCCKAPHGEAHMTSNDHMSERGSISSSTQTLSWLQPQQTAWLKPHRRPWTWTSNQSDSRSQTLSNCETKNDYCVKSLNLE